MNAELTNDIVQLFKNITPPSKRKYIITGVNNLLTSTLHMYHIDNFNQQNNLTSTKQLNERIQLVQNAMYPHNHLSWIYQTDYQKTLQFKITDFILNYIKNKVGIENIKYIDTSRFTVIPNINNKLSVLNCSPNIIFNDLCFAINIEIPLLYDNYKLNIFLENMSKKQITYKESYDYEYINKKDEDLINHIYYYNDHNDKKYEITTAIELLKYTSQNTKEILFINKDHLQFKALIDNKINNKDDILNIQNNIDYENKFNIKLLTQYLDYCFEQIK